MISHFPDPYKNELCYSITARFAARMQYPTQAATMAALFGGKHAVPAIELPHKLDYLIAQLPPGHGYTADMLIDGHTLFPYYGPFLSEIAYARLRENMKSDQSRITQMLAGIHATKIRPAKYLRTCPVCDAQNIKTYGETYWNRLHQIAGVEVCPTHGVFLQDTDVRRLDQLYRHQLFTAQNAVRSDAIVPVDENKASHRVMMSIAYAASELLDTPRQAASFQSLRNQYCVLLKHKGYITTGGRLRLAMLQAAFIKHFTPTLLKLLQCSVSGFINGGWLAAACRKSDSGVAPLRHILIMQFLGRSPESFFKEMNAPAVDSKVSFPCLNQVCSYHNQPVITERTFKRKKLPNGAFAVYRCPHCGHTSSRSRDGERIFRVIDFGHVWSKRLSELWDDAALSLHQIADRLHADVNTIRRRAVKMDLYYPRPGPRITKIKPKVGQGVKFKYTAKAQRTKWLKLRDQNPSLHKQQLRRLNQSLYAWLLRNDKDWYNANSPARQKMTGREYEVVDWQARDQVLVGKVITAASTIKNLSAVARVACQKMESLANWLPLRCSIIGWKNFP